MPAPNTHPKCLARSGRTLLFLVVLETHTACGARSALEAPNSGSRAADQGTNNEPATSGTPSTACQKGTRVIAITAGGDHSCALFCDGAARCWGGPDTPHPLPVLNLSAAQAIAAGEDYACLLISGGTVACWGNNFFGQLGDGSQHSSPTPVQVLNLHSVTAISAGSTHTCALLSDGTVACWGNNVSSGRGNVTLTASSTPVAVIGLHGVASVSAGYAHNCAVLSDSTVACWGSSYLGDGTTT